MGEIMNIYFIYEYINRMKKDDFINLLLKEGIIFDDDEIDIAFNYIKENYKRITKVRAEDVLEEIKFKFKPITYNKIVKLFTKYKDVIEAYNKKIREN